RRLCHGDKSTGILRRFNPKYRMCPGTLWSACSQIVSERVSIRLRVVLWVLQSISDGMEARERTASAGPNDLGGTRVVILGSQRAVLSHGISETNKRRSVAEVEWCVEGACRKNK